jgi:hypothetical protein
MLSAFLAALLQLLSASELKATNTTKTTKATKATKATALTPREPHDCLQSSLEVGHPEAIAISIQAPSGRTSKI